MVRDGMGNLIYPLFILVISHIVLVSFPVLFLRLVVFSSLLSTVSFPVLSIVSFSRLVFLRRCFYRAVIVSVVYHPVPFIYSLITSSLPFPIAIILPHRRIAFSAPAALSISSLPSPSPDERRRA